MAPAYSESPFEACVRPGAIFADKYRVEREIGRGGMGVVVAALHLELHTKVALKVMLPELARDERLVERFLREARATARLASEHVARVVDVGRHPIGSPYLVMELLEGEDLSAFVRRGGLSVGMATGLLLQACEGLSHAHAAGLVHRDLKPENLFVTRLRDGAHCVKVLDFGIAKDATAASQVTQTTDTFGSPHYMSPEQMKASRNVDARADIWALGVVAFELYSGELPFQANTVLELASTILTEPPRSLSSLRPDLPAPIVAIVMQCLDRRVDARPQTVMDVAAALSPYASGASDASGPHAVRQPSRAESRTESRGPEPHAPTLALTPVPGPPEAAQETRLKVFAIGALVASGLVLAAVLLVRSRAGSTGAGAVPERTSIPLLTSATPASASTPIAVPSVPTASAQTDPAHTSASDTRPTDSTAPHLVPLASASVKPTTGRPQASGNKPSPSSPTAAPPTSARPEHLDRHGD